MKKVLGLLFSILLSVTIISCGESSSSSTGQVDYTSQLKLDLNDTSSNKEKVTLKTCIDGDTTHFYSSIDQDGVLKARYLAIDTPESTGKIQAWGKAASNFNKSKLEKAESIYVESEDTKWNLDSTGERYLVWVWYRLDATSDYRLLNLELLENGYAATKNYSSTKYAEIFGKAHNQAISLKLRYYGTEKDPDFDYGTYAQVTLKEIRTNINDYVDKNVRFEGLIVLNGSDNTYTVVDYDAEDDMHYGIPVYAGYNFAGISLLKIGNRLSFAATITYSANYGYQASGLNYFAMRPENEKCLRLVSENNPVEPTTITVDYFNTNKALIDATYVKLEGLTVTNIYTTTNTATSSVGAMTLTCKDENNKSIQVRTSVLYEEDGKTLITESAYKDKVIDIIGEVDEYEGEYQIHVYTSSDITVKD